MKVVKITASSLLKNASCLDCNDLNYTGPMAEGKAFTHAEENDGHRVMLINQTREIYERKEMM